jgi:hypothetical protein
MSTSFKSASLEHFISEIVHSLVDAFVALNVLRGLRNAARAKTDLATKYSLAHDEIYRAAFDSLYIRIGRVVDTSDDSYTLQALIERLRNEWKGDSERISHLDAVAQGLTDANADVLGKLKRWRNKAIAHRTDQTTNATYYQDNKVSIDEVDVSLRAVQSLFNELTYSATGTIHDCTDATPSLETQVQQLFGLAD